ncbi:MAG TPA: J domain-containing protein [Polyangiaceae bacterium]|nr:J domain-containing protein [Polyangiaceae bacterium]
MTKIAGLTPTAEGLLEKTPLVHLLVYLADRELTGSLVLSSRSGGEDHAIYFFEGQASKVRTGEPIAHLGRVLFELGILSEETLNASLAAFSRGNDLHGEHLVRAGVIDHANLMEGLKVQADRKMAFLFALPGDTKYRFYQDVNVLAEWGGPEMIPLDTLPIIWSAVRVRADDPIVDATLRRLGPTTLKLHIMSDVSRFGFSAHEQAAIDTMRASPSSLAGLIETRVVPRRTAELIVYTLLITRHLDHRADSAPPVGLSKPSSVNTPAAAPASAPEGVPVARVKLTARQVPIEEPPPASPRSSAPPPAPLSPELAARRDAIVKRAESIDREDYFAMLGVAQQGAPGDVQSAYFALAKLWHPDRLPPELAGVRDAASKVFARMSEAFETLSDGVRRKRYVDVMKGGGGTPEEADQIQQIIDAATDFQRAEILWKKRDPGAEEFINRAYKSDPEQSDYIALYATLQLSKRPPDAPVDDLIKLCDHAIANSERCELAYFCRANLKKRIGRIESAMVDFKDAYELNPKNLDAAREVRLFEMRRSKMMSEQRRTTPSTRRSTPPPGQRSSPPPRTSPPPKKPSGAPPKKEGGVLSGIGKLFKR